MLKVIMLILLICSCSTQKKVKDVVILPIGELNQCLKYRDQILNGSLMGNGHTLEFITDEPHIRESFYQFNPNQLVRSVLASNANVLLNNCSQKNLQNYRNLKKLADQCDLSFQELSYLQALLKAYSRQNWPLNLKLEAKKLLLNYLTYFTKGDFLLVDSLVPFSVLFEMSTEGIVDYRIADLAKSNLMSIKSQLELLEKSSPRGIGLTCQYLASLHEELRMAKGAQKELIKLLKLI